MWKRYVSRRLTVKPPYGSRIVFKRGDIEAIRAHKARIERQREQNEARGLLVILFVGGILCVAIAWLLP